MRSADRAVGIEIGSVAEVAEGTLACFDVAVAVVVVVAVAAAVVVVVVAVAAVVVVVGNSRYSC